MLWRMQYFGGFRIVRLYCIYHFGEYREFQTVVHVIFWRHSNHQYIANAICCSRQRLQAIAAAILWRHYNRQAIVNIMFQRALSVRTIVTIILWRHTSHQTIASTVCGLIWRFQAVAAIILCKHECQAILNTIVCRVWRVQDIILWTHSNHQTSKRNMLINMEAPNYTKHIILDVVEEQTHSKTLLCRHQSAHPCELQSFLEALKSPNYSKIHYVGQYGGTKLQ